MKETINVDEVVKVLNEYLEKDSKSVLGITNVASQCNVALAAIPNLSPNQTQYGSFEITGLGLINSFFGVYEQGPAESFGPIALIRDGNKLKFVKIDNTFEGVKVLEQAGR